MGSGDSSDECIENSDRNAASLVGFIQIFSDNSALKLKITVLVPYPVRTNLANGRHLS